MTVDFAEEVLRIVDIIRWGILGHSPESLARIHSKHALRMLVILHPWPGHGCWDPTFPTLVSRTQASELDMLRVRDKLGCLHPIQESWQCKNQVLVRCGIIVRWLGSTPNFTTEVKFGSARHRFSNSFEPSVRCKSLRVLDLFRFSIHFPPRLSILIEGLHFGTFLLPKPTY